VRVTFYEGHHDGTRSEVGHSQVVDDKLVGAASGTDVLQNPPQVIQPGTLTVLTATQDPAGWLENVPALYRTPYAQAFLER
jgi:hypothetical protein